MHQGVQNGAWKCVLPDAKRVHLNVSRTGIQGVLHQLLDGCRKVDHHLPAGNYMDNILWDLPDHRDIELADLERRIAGNLCESPSSSVDLKGTAEMPERPIRNRGVNHPGSACHLFHVQGHMQWMCFHNISA